MSYLPFDQSNLAVENGGNLASIATTDLLTMRIAEANYVAEMQAKMLALYQTERWTGGYGYSSRDFIELR